MSVSNNTRVAIIIEHGLADEIYSSDPNAEIAIVDMDCQDEDAMSEAQKTLSAVRNDPDMHRIGLTDISDNDGSDTITITLKNPVIIKPDGSIAITLSDADRVTRETRRHDGLKDIMAYLSKDDCEYDDILGNEELINNILDLYVEYREDADGGCPENCIPWDECLERAVKEAYTDYNESRDV